jgi:hypothetical protein
METTVTTVTTVTTATTATIETTETTVTVGEQWALVGLMSRQRRPESAERFSTAEKLKPFAREGDSLNQLLFLFQVS